MADVKWIKIVTDIFDDEKILLIESMPESDSIIVIWFKLLCLAGKQNNDGVFMMGNIAYTDEMLATVFRRPINTVRMALETFDHFGMIEIVNDAITIPKWSKHQNLDKIEKTNEQARLRMQKYRERQKLISESGDSVTLRNGNVTLRLQNKKENKNKKENNILYSCPSSCVDVRHTDEKTDHFDLDRCWREYPNKKGKNKITKKALAELDKLGTEKVLLAIGRYKAEIERNKTDMQYIQHGSTFFNGGYADYIAEDWKLPERKNGDGLPVYDDFEIPF